MRIIHFRNPRESGGDMEHVELDGHRRTFRTEPFEHDFSSWRNVGRLRGRRARETKAVHSHCHLETSCSK